MRENLIRKFTCFASIACISDLYLDRAKTGYLCVTTHYVDNNWTFQKDSLLFEKLVIHMMPPLYIIPSWKVLIYMTSKKKFWPPLLIIHLLVMLLLTVSRQSWDHLGRILSHKKCAYYIINLCVQDGMKHFEFYFGQHSRGYELHNECWCSNSRVCLTLPEIQHETKKTSYWYGAPVELKIFDVGSMSTIQGCYKWILQHQESKRAAHIS